jgi:hypothetical protein
MTNTGATDVAVQVLKQLKRASQQRACALGIASQLDLAQPPSALSVPCWASGCGPASVWRLRGWKWSDADQWFLSGKECYGLFNGGGCEIG